MAIGSSGCIQFPWAPGTVANIKGERNATLCYYYDSSFTPIPTSWNRSFGCNGSESLFKLCINDVNFSDSGNFALHSGISGGAVLASVTLLVEGKSVLVCVYV